MIFKIFLCFTGGSCFFLWREVVRGEVMGVEWERERKDKKGVWKVGRVDRVNI